CRFQLQCMLTDDRASRNLDRLFVGQVALGLHLQAVLPWLDLDVAQRRAPYFHAIEADNGTADGTVGRMGLEADDARQFLQRHRLVLGGALIDRQYYLLLVIALVADPYPVVSRPHQVALPQEIGRAHVW